MFVALLSPQATFGVGEFLHTLEKIRCPPWQESNLCQNHAFIDGNKRVGATTDSGAVVASELPQRKLGW